MSGNYSAVGQHYGKLTVVGRAANDKYGRPIWLCDCECGTKNHSVAGACLRRTKNPTRSCGCLVGEAMKHRTRPWKSLAKDISGQKFSRWTVIRRAANDKYGFARWACVCDCGCEKTVNGVSLRAGQSQSCGCLSVDTARRLSMGRLRGPDLVGQKFGRLTVLHKAEVLGQRRGPWLCVCICGKEVAVWGHRLTSGDTKSCGCMGGGPTTTHGMRNYPEYTTWCGMKARCSDSKNNRYRYYGGRGIQVCAAWKQDFAAFYRDVGPRPSKKYSIDRINVNGNYEPGNVRWATASEQVRNRRPFHLRTAPTDALLEELHRRGVHVSTAS